VLTALVFNVAAVVAASFATSTERLSAGATSALLWVVLLFSSAVSLPRVFIGEEEAGTGDFLRLVARPHSVFWGKALFNLALMLATALLLSLLFLLLSAPPSLDAPVYALSLIAGSAALSGSVTLCGALVAQASHRFVLAGAISVPLNVPLMAAAVGATQASFGGGRPGAGAGEILALAAYSVAMYAIGPYLFAAVWKG
jgi:heme exporter protein B